MLWCTPMSAYAEPSMPSPVELTVRKGTVRVSNNGDKTFTVRVYAITGALVSEFSLEPLQQETIELPSGYYIIKAGDSARRVAV